MVLGVTGKIGSGKSTCIEYIKENYCAIVFSADEVAKELIESGEVDYKVENGALFFSDCNLQELCRTKLHPVVFSRIKRNIENIKNKINKNNFLNNEDEITLKKEKSTNFNNLLKKNNFTEFLIIVETALPNDMFFDMCDKVILIESNFENKAKWLMESRKYGIGKTKMIYDSQEYYEKFYDRADIKIINNGNLKSFKDKIKEVIDEIYFAGK